MEAQAKNLIEPEMDTESLDSTPDIDDQSDLENNAKKPKHGKAANKNSQNSREGSLSYQDMPLENHVSLPVIYHKPLYPLSIPSNPKYQNLSICERTKLLSEYHSAIATIRADLAHKSKRMAPMPKPIMPSTKCKTSMLKNAQDVEEQSDVTNDETDIYVSRSGRQIKRKLYAEESGTDSDSSQLTMIKKNKFDNDSAKITLDTLFPMDLGKPNNAADQSIDASKKKAPLSTKKAGGTPESVRKTFSTKRTTKSEKLFENLLQEDAKQKKQQEEMRAFEQTLVIEDDNSQDMFADVHDKVIHDPLSDQSDENFVVKRVIPPLRGRKPINKKRPVQEENLDRIDVVPESSPKPKNNDGKLLRSKSNDSTPGTSSQSNREQRVRCPLCDKLFPKNIIEEHASTCCEISEDSSNQPTSQKTLTCEVCDERFLYSTAYEQHVKQCIASKIHNL